MTGPTATARGVEVPKLGVGTWRLQGAACRRAVATALEVGYRHVDTAQLYGNEVEVGEALASSDVARDEVFLATKLAPWNVLPGRVRPSVEASLARLGTPYVDLLIVHWPVPPVPVAGTVEAMGELVEAGLVRHLGVSNHPPRRLERVDDHAGGRLLTDQVQYHVRLDRSDHLEAVRARDLVLTAYSPLAHGGVLGDPVLAEVGARHGATAAQVALAWLVQQEDVVAIPRSTDRGHLRENLEAADLELAPAEMDEVHRPSWVGTWARWLEALVRPGSG